MFSKSSQEDPNLYTLIDSQGDIYLYECKYTLPLGFMVNNHPGFNISSGDSQTASGEVGEGGSQEQPGTESTPAMSYMYSNIRQSYPGSILHDPIEGVKIQTASSKPYYFTYKTWNEGKTWYYPAVKSTEDDDAGMSGRPIQRLNIQVFRNDGTALESGVVVMYRV